MTRRRQQYERNLATLAARYEATERELDELGPAAAPAPPLEPVTAEEWDDPEVTPAAVKADIIRRLGLRIAIVPSPARRVRRGCHSTSRGSRSPSLEPRSSSPPHFEKLRLTSGNAPLTV